MLNAHFGVNRSELSSTRARDSSISYILIACNIDRSSTRFLERRRPKLYELNEVSGYVILDCCADVIFLSPAGPNANQLVEGLSTAKAKRPTSDWLQLKNGFKKS